MTPASGPKARYGAKPAIVSGGLGLAVILPFLSAVATPLALAVTLLGFGASLGGGVPQDFNPSSGRSDVIKHL